MTPTETLHEALELARATTRLGYCPDGGELSALVLALDEWITGGGELPDQWKRAQ